LQSTLGLPLILTQVWTPAIFRKPKHGWKRPRDKTIGPTKPLIPRPHNGTQCGRATRTPVVCHALCRA
jgi:hypothetical protein